MALVFLIEEWSAEAWAGEMAGLAPGLDCRIWPDHGSDEEIDYALVWKPPAGVLRRFANLKAIFSLGAGVDHIFQDPDLPEDVPVVRVVDRDITMRMVEYVVLHVLMHHRRQRLYDGFQRQRKWREARQPAARETRVGIMGLGVLGAACAERLRDLGFQVAGWSRCEKSISGVESFAGDAALGAFLSRTHILVSLLPYTPATHGILNRALFAQLAGDRPVDGPVLINAGRGRTQNETDILGALDDGTLYAATLDVFEDEPLAASSPLWAHPRVTITPHNASVSDPAALCRYVHDQILRHERGEPFTNVVDPKRAY